MPRPSHPPVRSGRRRGADRPSGLALLEGHPEVVLLFTDAVLAGPINGRKVADEALRYRPILRGLFTTGFTRDTVMHQGLLGEDMEPIAKSVTAASLAGKVRPFLEAS